MKRVRTFQTNFSAGQLDPLMASRTDTKAYVNGADTLTNFSPLVQGGIKKRPGTVYLQDLTEAVRLIPFIFNESQLYIIALANAKMYIYGVDGTLHQTISSGVPWTTSNLYEVRYTQRSDVMILVHEDFAMQKLTRTGATTFTLADLDFETGDTGKKYAPFYKFADSDVTIDANGTSGSITLTTSANHWTTDHVGARVSIHGQQATITGYTSAVVVSATTNEDLFTDQTLTASGGGCNQFVVGEVVTQTDSQAEGEIVSVDSDTQITVANLKNAKFKTNGASELTVGGESGAEVTVTTVADTATPEATKDWQEEVFSDERGYARSVIFHSQRLWFGGSKELPAHLFSSAVADFFTFDVGTAQDSDSIQAPIASDQVNSINHLVSAGHLQVFTDQAEFYCPESENSPLIPADFNIRRQASYGTSDVRPVTFDRATLFVQGAGKVIREMRWEEIEGGYTPNAISLIATNLIDEDGIKDSAVVYGMEKRPEQFAFFVNDDGTLLVYHAARAENISAWFKWETDGLVKDVVAMEENLYLYVERTVNSVTKHYLERLDDSVTLDCSKSVTSGSATATFSGFTHLAQEEISVVADHEQTSHADYHKNAFYLEEYTPTAGGVITLTGGYTTYTITAGFKYTATAKTMPMDWQASDGQITGLPKRISAVDMVLDSSMVASVEGNSLLMRDVTDDLSKPPTAKTGRFRFYLLGWDKEGQITMSCPCPLEMTLLGLMMEVAY